jgi:prepilin-type processing-associated H-X9-DG protein
MAWNIIVYTKPAQSFRDCLGNTTSIGDALVRYERQHKRLPAAGDKQVGDHVAVSWRVAILPFFGYWRADEVAAKYKASEVWDGPTNATLRNVDIFYYHCPSDGAPTTNASYLAVIGPNTPFADINRENLAELTKGASHTIVIAETVDAGIHWMAPQDFPLDKAARGVGVQPGPSIASRHFADGGVTVDGAHVVYVDGHAEWLSTAIDPKVLRQLLETKDPKLPPK